MSLNKQLADVNVITKGRFTNKPYTYLVPEHLENTIAVNDLVCIPFNNREIDGIIRKVYTEIPNDKYSYLYIKSIKSNVDKTLLKYIEKVSDFYINPIGHSIYYYFSDFIGQKTISKCKVNESSDYYFGIDCRKLLLNNLKKDTINIIYCPSLKIINDISKYLESFKVNIVFKQTAGGKKEQKLLDSKIAHIDKGVVLSLTTGIFNPQLDKGEIFKHFWDINHYKYNEDRKPNFHLIDVANIQNTYTHHKHIYYGEFPNYKYVVCNENIKFKLPDLNATYFYGNTVKDALNSLVSYKSNSNISEATFNLDYCSTHLKNNISEYMNIDGGLRLYKESSKISDINILVEPTISHNRILNSSSLSKLVRYLYRLSNSNSKLFIVTTNDNEILSTLTEDNINMWLSEEFIHRNKYGPNHKKKVIEIYSKDPISINNLDIKGPIKDQNNNMYQYQLTYDYNDSYQANIYDKLKKFNYSFINYF